MANAKPKVNLVSDTPSPETVKADRIALIVSKLSGMIAGKAFKIEVDLPPLIGDQPFTEAEVNAIVSKLGTKVDAGVVRQVRYYLSVSQYVAETIVAAAAKFATDHKGETTANAFTLRNNMLKAVRAGVTPEKAIEKVWADATVLDAHGKALAWFGRIQTALGEPKGAFDWSRLDTAEKSRPSKEKILAAIQTLKGAKFVGEVKE